MHAAAAADAAAAVDFPGLLVRNTTPVDHGATSLGLGSFAWNLQRLGLRISAFPFPN